MHTVSPNAATSRRSLILHDSLAFLALLGTSVALFGVTLFLFRSFQAHRADLARRWSARGQIALQQHQPEEAVAALRTALSYDSEGAQERADQLTLAQALAAAGHTEEATNYFLNLWDAAPGNGSINLQLARLARAREDTAAATNYYRAAIYGSWEGDAILRRRETRLELASFLIEQHQLDEARNELFTVAGNAPGDAALNLLVAAKLESAGFLADALAFDKKAAAADPHARLPLARAGRVAYALGQYAEAEHLLNRALEEEPSKAVPSDQDQLVALAADARRIQQLNLSRDQPADERADHILAAASLAQNRLRACLVNSTAAPLADLNAQWLAADSGHSNRWMLLQNAAAQDTWTKLIYTTEQQTAQQASCGAPTRDDQLLLQLANAAQPTAPATAPQWSLPIQDANRPSFVRRLFSGSGKEQNHGK